MPCREISATCLVKVFHGLRRPCLLRCPSPWPHIPLQIMPSKMWQTNAHKTLIMKKYFAWSLSDYLICVSLMLLRWSSVVDVPFGGHFAGGTELPTVYILSIKWPGMQKQLSSALSPAGGDKSIAFAVFGSQPSTALSKCSEQVSGASY